MYCLTQEENCRLCSFRVKLSSRKHIRAFVQFLIILWKLSAIKWSPPVLSFWLLLPGFCHMPLLQPIIDQGNENAMTVLDFSIFTSGKRKGVTFPGCIIESTLKQNHSSQLSEANEENMKVRKCLHGRLSTVFFTNIKGFYSFSEWKMEFRD